MAPVDESPQASSDLPDPSSRLPRPIPGAYMALGLLLAMNLFNYIDRQVLAAVEPEIRRSFFPQDPERPCGEGQIGVAGLGVPDFLHAHGAAVWGLGRSAGRGDGN